VHLGYLSIGKRTEKSIYWSVQSFNRLLANKEEGYAFYIGRHQVEFSKIVKKRENPKHIIYLPDFKIVHKKITSCLLKHFFKKN